MIEKSLSFEQGPIRPPSEAGSLLLRVTRNCPWNRCVFCASYKGKKFSRRTMEEIKADIDTVREIRDSVKKLSWRAGDAGALTRQVFTNIMKDPSLSDSFRSVVLWMASGGDTVFLQDANSLILSTEKLIEVLNYVRQNFPEVNRITSYARASTLKNKTVDEYVRLKEVGLSRLHVGMESGADEVLKMIDKGARADQIIEGGKRVVEAGISLSLYLIPGIGGTELSAEHAAGCVRVINAVNPAFVRFRSLYVRPDTLLGDMVERGTFHPPDEDSMVREIRTIIENLDGVTTTIVSDHILNLLEEVDGTLPGDKERMLRTIDGYLNLPANERLLFQLGRRGGAIRSLDELQNPSVKTRLEEAKRQVEQQVSGGIPVYLEAVKRQFV
jgi:histone acetyltransferase (RNA polymerase elongator complex component)